MIRIYLVLIIKCITYIKIITLVLLINSLVFNIYKIILNINTSLDINTPLEKYYEFKSHILFL